MEVATAEESVFTVQRGSHPEILTSKIAHLCNSESFADCFLVGADGLEIPAHKIVLAAASPLLDNILRRRKDHLPTLILGTIQHEDLLAIVKYMYKGSVEIPVSRLTSFSSVAKILQISEFMDEDDEEVDQTLKKCNVKESKPEADESSVEMISLSQLNREDDDPLSDSVEVEYLSDEYEVLDEQSKDGEIKDNAESTDLLNSSIGEDPLEFNSHKTITKRIRQEQKLRSSVRKTAKSSVKCSRCGGMYKNSSTFMNHLRYDCDQRHYCSTCQHVFKNKRHLLDHIRDDCGRTHVCPNCGSEFKQKVNLTTHLKNYCKTAKNYSLLIR